MNYVPKMIPQLCQLWQADTGANGTSTSTDAGGTTVEVPADFGSIFDALTQADDAPKIAGKEEEGVVEAVTDGADAATATAGKETPEDGLPDPAKVEADAAAAVAAAAAGQVEGDTTKVETPKVEEKSLEQVMRELLAERVAQPAVEAGPTEAEKAAAAEAQRQRGPVYSTEEKALLDSYMREFPEIAVAEELKRREEYKIFAAAIFGLIEQKYGSRMEGLTQFAQQTGAQTHQHALSTAIPDYAEVRQPVLDWIKTQPANLKAAFDDVATKGSVDDIKTMVDFWRTVTGKPAAQAAPDAAAVAAAAAAKTKAAQPAATRKLLDSLKAPTTKRTAVGIETGIDPNNFEDAFNAFADVEL